MLLSKGKKIGIFFQICVAFSEYMNFNKRLGRFYLLTPTVMFFFCLPENGGQDDGSDLEKCNNDNEKAIGSQEDAGFLNGTTVA